MLISEEGVGIKQLVVLYDPLGIRFSMWLIASHPKEVIYQAVESFIYMYSEPGAHSTN
jgi:hypothetical protein